MITLNGIDFAYGTQPIYQGLDFQAERGQRTVLVGPNGAGKSTLLKLLAGVLEPQAGTRELGHNVKFGYFAQHRVEMLNGRQTVLEAVLDSPAPVRRADRAHRPRLVPLSAATTSSSRSPC